jgi:propanol-preferring alcohol dehydrogenase
MRAMLLRAPRQELELSEIPTPAPGPGQVRIRVGACGVCRTDLHVFDGELKHPKLPLVLGHEIVGRVDALAPGVNRFRVGDRVGVPWLGWTCGQCRYCLSERENLCLNAKFMGYQIDGGYADYTVADERYVFPLPGRASDASLAPLMCAGLIGYRSLVAAGPAKALGLYGFGAAAHIIIQVAVHQGREVYAFTRPGDTDTQSFARELGAAWAGDSDQTPPGELEAAIIFAPVGSLVPLALRATGPGGIVVCAGIHMSDIPVFPYEWLWRERCIRSVANLTRADGEAFLSLCADVPIRTDTQVFPLEQGNEALKRLRSGQVHGAAVLGVDEQQAP